MLVWECLIVNILQQNSIRCYNKDNVCVNNETLLLNLQLGVTEDP